MTELQVRAAVEMAINCSGGVRKLAKSWGVSPAHLSDVRNGRRAPGDLILRHFGLRKVVAVSYEPGPAASDWPKAGNPEASPDGR